MDSWYRKKPDKLECRQYDGSNDEELQKWLQGINVTNLNHRWPKERRSLNIWHALRQTWIEVYVDSWIVKSSTGLDVVSDECFKENYEHILFETLVPKSTPVVRA